MGPVHGRHHLLQQSNYPSSSPTEALVAFFISPGLLPHRRRWRIWPAQETRLWPLSSLHENGGFRNMILISSFVIFFTKQTHWGLWKTRWSPVQEHNVHNLDTQLQPQQRGQSWKARWEGVWMGEIQPTGYSSIFGDQHFLIRGPFGGQDSSVTFFSFLSHLTRQIQNIVSSALLLIIFSLKGLVQKHQDALLIYN